MVICYLNDHLGGEMRFVVLFTNTSFPVSQFFDIFPDSNSDSKTEFLSPKTEGHFLVVLFGSPPW